MDIFLAGFKVAKPQWHDLRKESSDLPKEQKEYWCKVFFYDSEETFNAFLFFDTRRKGFFFQEEIEDEDYKGTSFDVSEWCEISQYKE